MVRWLFGCLRAVLDVVASGGADGWAFAGSGSKSLGLPRYPLWSFFFLLKSVSDKRAEMGRNKRGLTTRLCFLSCYGWHTVAEFAGVMNRAIWCGVVLLTSKMVAPSSDLTALC